MDRYINIDESKSQQQRIVFFFKFELLFFNSSQAGIHGFIRDCCKLNGQSALSNKIVQVLESIIGLETSTNNTRSDGTYIS